MINPYAIGKQVYLRAPSEEDLTGSWYEWLSDPETTQYLGNRYWPNTREAQKEFYQSTLHSKERLVLSICLIENDQHIGVCNLSDLNLVHRYADVAFIIGDKKHRNGQFALDALSLLLQIAFLRFNLLNLKSVYISTNPYTPLIERIFGFKEVGRLEKFYFFNGTYVDGIISQLSKDDWEKRNKRD